MILASLALAAMTVLAPSTNAAAAPALGNFLHFHSHADARVSLTLTNSTPMFRDVAIDGQTYTVRSHGTLTIKAPIGTRIYAASRTPAYKRGDLMLELTPQAPSQLSLQ